MTDLEPATDYSTQPLPLDIARAERSGRARDISPRSALIETLRDIDAGTIDPDTLIVCWRERNDGLNRTSFIVSSQDPLVTMGLLARSLHRINEPG